VSTCTCGKPTRDNAVLCDDCTNALGRALGDVAWVVAELDTTITRQKAAAIGSGPRSSGSAPLPWHERAAEAKRDLHAILVAWVRFADEEHLAGRPTWWPQDRPASLARWLLHVVHALARHELAPDALDEVTDAVATAERIVFWKRKNRIYLGTCGQTVTDEDGEVLTLTCPGEVYAEEGDAVGTCDECGQGVTVVIRKSEIEQRLADRLCTAAEIATYAVHLGLEAPREKVRQRVHYWHRHKRLTPHGTSPAGDPTFRYGDVRGMLYAEFGRRDAS
jgi:hypothetical protein